MENKNARNFEVKITDIRTGDVKYVGLSNCIFLASYEDCGARLIRLSQCDTVTKAFCYGSVKFGLEDTFKNDPFLSAIVDVLSQFPPMVGEDV